LYSIFLIKFINQDNITQTLPIDFLLDTGATNSSLPQSLNPYITGQVNVNTTNGIHTLNQTIAYMIIDNVEYLSQCSLINQSYGLLGLDILKYFNITLDCEFGCLLIKK